MGAMATWSRPISKASSIIMDHDRLLEMLRLRIDDQAFLQPDPEVAEGRDSGDRMDTVIHPETGTPQGGIVSPDPGECVSALCRWTCGLRRWSKPDCRGRAHDVSVCR